MSMDQCPQIDGNVGGWGPFFVIRDVKIKKKKLMLDVIFKIMGSQAKGQARKFLLPQSI